jgi:O-antigen/teichoic acid export membrane protein
LIRERVLRASLTNWLNQVATLAIRFVLTPFILHRLGDTQFGLWALIGAVIGQGEMLDFGIKAALTKYAAEFHSQGEYGQARRLIATSFLLYCGLGLLALLAAATVAPIFPHLFNVPPSEQGTAMIVVLLMGVQLAVTLPGSASGAVLWGLHRYGLVNALIMTSTVLSAVITVTVLLAGGGLIAMVAAGIPLAFGMLGGGIYLLNLVAPELRLSLTEARRDLVRSVVSFSSATFTIETAASLQIKFNEIIIGAFMPVSAVGPYSLARRMSDVPQTAAAQTIGGYIPLASELQAGGSTDRLRALYLVGSRVALAVCVPLAAVLIALAGPLLALWLGPQYSQYAPIVVILTLTSVASITRQPGGLIVQGMGRHHRLAVAYVCAALANVAIAILLVRPYGLLGVAVATLISSIGLNLCYVWPFVLRLLDIRWLDFLNQALLPGLVPVLPMTAVIYGMDRFFSTSGIMSISIIAAAALLTYAAAYLVFGAGDPEKRLLWGILANLRSGSLLRSKAP